MTFFYFQFIIIYSAVEYTPVTYESYEYPAWASGIGWMMNAVALMFIPLIALVEYCKAHGFLEVGSRPMASIKYCKAYGSLEVSGRFIAPIGYCKIHRTQEACSRPIAPIGYCKIHRTLEVCSRPIAPIGYRVLYSVRLMGF